MVGLPDTYTALQRLPPNNALQRRPQSEFHIDIGVLHAVPLNAGVRHRRTPSSECLTPRR